MKKKHLHIPLLICAISVTLFTIVFYGYMYYAVGLSTSRAVLARDIALAQELNKGQEKQIEDLFSSTREERESLRSYFISADDPIRFIEEFEALGKQSGSVVAISSINTEGSESMSARVDIKGSWQSVMRAIMLVESMPYAVSVGAVRLDATGMGGAGNNTSWSASFEARIKMLPK